jgi:hypothetical protein
VSEYDQYRARIDRTPDEAIALLTASLLDDGFHPAELEGFDEGFIFGPDEDPYDEVGLVRFPDRSTRLRLLRFGWRFNDDRFREPHQTSLEFVAVEDGSRIEATGWICEVVEDYLLRLGASFTEERVVASYVYPYASYVSSFIADLREDGWIQGPRRHPLETSMTDGKGGRASVSRQGPETIIQMQSEVDGHRIVECFVISSQKDMTMVHMSGNAPLLSLEVADGAAHTAFVKSAVQLGL